MYRSDDGFRHCALRMYRSDDGRRHCALRMFLSCRVDLPYGESSAAKLLKFCFIFSSDVCFISNKRLLMETHLGAVRMLEISRLVLATEVQPSRISSLLIPLRFLPSICPSSSLGFYFVYSVPLLVLPFFVFIFLIFFSVSTFNPVVCFCPLLFLLIISLYFLSFVFWFHWSLFCSLFLLYVTFLAPLPVRCFVVLFFNLLLNELIS